MNPDDIKQLLDLVRTYDLAEFEFEEGTFKLRVKRGGAHAAMPVTHVPAPVPLTGHSADSPVPQAAPVEAGAELAIVKSPIVGTFYRAAEPGAPALASVGDQVKKGQVLCIIEAMKLMNEIDSEYDGEVVNVYVENGQPVQYGERIFAIRLRA